MKLKHDFVTNSSSVSFIFEAQTPIYRRHIRWSFHKWDRFVSLWSKKQLIAYTQQSKCDWINEITGPKMFYNMDEDRYNKCLQIINKGKVAVLTLTNKYRDYNKLERKIKERYAHLRFKEFR